jgi:hypothetical protein
MDAKTKKTWLSIAIAVVIVLAILGIGLLGTAFYVFRQHVSAQFVSSDRAETEFEEMRRRFAGQQPLIELSNDHREPIIHPRRGEPAEIQTLRVLDPHAGKLVRVNLPFWLLRMAPSRKSSFRSAGVFDFDTDRVRLGVDDVERAGPGLVLDARDPGSGALVLVWAE